MPAWKVTCHVCGHVARLQVAQIGMSIYFFNPSPVANQPFRLSSLSELGILCNSAKKNSARIDAFCSYSFSHLQ